jgi:hypothetical protein
MSKGIGTPAGDNTAEYQFEVGAWPSEGTLLGNMPDESSDGPIMISNEFVDVVVTRVHTRNGVRLDIWSPRRGSRVQLDAMILDCLSYQPPSIFSDMLADRPAG